ncbi:7201_t:CDS:2 [Diversispora eburnea]|uniref:7201_t:CDS:1 n=1 Tax=Diversispora eburnea TaxID=1213867 RepID=A0A9N9BRJ2_9GLOM|nr:7201_t:CDS:2 [Diversispora eburnea]
MPKIKHSRTKKPPEGFEDIEPTLLEFAQKMKDAENEPHEGKRRVESLWPIFRLHHQRSRYIYDLYYKREAISKEVYDYCLKLGYADANLIAKWKKPGFERLCCLRCIQPKDTNFGTTCICRVPKSKLEEGRIVECVLCGCRGCSSTDFTSAKKDKSKQKTPEEINIQQDSSQELQVEQISQTSQMETLTSYEKEENQNEREESE